MFCRNCGATVPDDAVYCNECGKKINRFYVMKDRVGNEIGDNKSKVILALCIIIIVLAVVLIFR